MGFLTFQGWGVRNFVHFGGSGYVLAKGILFGKGDINKQEVDFIGEKNYDKRAYNAI